jgi:hypothetical protein
LVSGIAGISTVTGASIFLTGSAGFFGAGFSAGSKAQPDSTRANSTPPAASHDVKQLDRLNRFMQLSLYNSTLAKYRLGLAGL